MRCRRVLGERSPFTLIPLEVSNKPYSLLSYYPLNKYLHPTILTNLTSYCLQLLAWIAFGVFLDLDVQGGKNSGGLPYLYTWAAGGDKWKNANLYQLSTFDTILFFLLFF